MDQFTHMQHDQVWSSRQKAAATKIALEAILVVCRSDSIKKTAIAQFTPRRHDTTRQYATRPVFSLPKQSNGSVHTYAARQCLVVTTNSCGTKNRSGSDFCRVSQRQYHENCYRNHFP